MENLNQNDRMNQKDAAFIDAPNYGGMNEISLEERQEILDSIELALIREQGNSVEVDKSAGLDDGSKSASMKQVTLPKSKARKRSMPLPVWMNVGALLLVGTGSFAIWNFLGMGNDAGSLASAGIISTEGLIVERLLEETQAKIAAKNKELEEIRGQLKGIESEKLEVEEEIEQKLAMREGELRAEFRAVLETERKRLIATGISENQLVREMADYEAAMQEEMERRITESRARLENEYKSRIAELNARYDLYEFQISSNNAEIERLTAEVVSLESEIQYLEKSEYSEALRALEELQTHRENEDGIRAQVAAYYERLSDNWQKGDSAATIKLLDSLDSYLNEPEIRQSEVVRNNRSINSFLITAIRRLVNLEEAVKDTEARFLASRESGSGSEDLARTEVLPEAVEEGRRLERLLSAFLLDLDVIKKEYSDAYNETLENNSDDSERLAYLLSDKLRIKSDLEPSSYVLFDKFVESARTLEAEKVREQMYGKFLETIDELLLKL